MLPTLACGATNTLELAAVVLHPVCGCLRYLKLLSLLLTTAVVVATTLVILQRAGAIEICMWGAFLCDRR